MSGERFLKALRTDFTLGGYFPRTLAIKHSEGVEFSKNSDEYWMFQALLASMNAVGWSSPNPSVGCVMVRNNDVIAKGFTQAYRNEHAEKMAFQEAVRLHTEDELSGATLYVTLEPCAHHGNQPPCLDLILNSKISRIVIACEDFDDRVSGKSIDALTKAGKEVVVGVLENECKAWNFPFLKNRMTKKIVWAAKWAQTASGLLADDDGTSQWITGANSRAYSHWLRQKYDAVLVGAGTWLKDRPSLTVRDCAEPHRRNPIRLVFDPQGKLLKLPPAEQKIHALSPLKVFVGKEQLIASGAHSKADIEWVPLRALDPIQSLIEEVDRLPIQSVMVEGGAKLLNSIFIENRFDACHEFIGSKEFNNASGRNRLSEFKKDLYYKLIEQKIDDDLLREWIK